MKKITLLFLLVLSSCGIEYDGETKLIVKGKITDSNNTPLINKEVKLFVTSEGGILPFIFYTFSEENFIGKAFTNSNGEYTMILPSPKNNFDEIIVETNPENNLLNPKQYRNIQTNDFINYQLTIPNSKLYLTTDLTDLNLSFNQTANNQLIQVDFSGEYTNFVEDFNFIPSEFTPDFYYLKVKRNQNFIVNYKIRNPITNEITNNTTTISIDNSNVINQTINY